MQQSHKNKLIDNQEHQTRHKILLTNLEEIFSLYSSEKSGAFYESVSMLDLLKWSAQKVKDQESDDNVLMHEFLDELIADWVYHQTKRTGIMLSRSSVNDLLKWSISQSNETTDIVSESEVEKVEEKNESEEALPPEAQGLVGLH